MNLVLLFVGSFFVFIIFGGAAGIAYFFWRKSQRTKFTWSARCYQLGKGKKPLNFDDRGRAVGTMNVHDLIPYTRDIIVKEERGPGLTVYRLAKQKISVEPVVADDVEVWGPTKEVDVLVHEGIATIMHKGYDDSSNTTLFTALPRNRVELLNAEREIKKSQLRGQKTDVWGKITMIMGFVMGFLTITAVAYFSAQGFMASAEANKEMAKSIDKFSEVMEVYGPYMATKDINRSTPVVVRDGGVKRPPSIE